MKSKTIGMFVLAVLLVPTVACASEVEIQPEEYEMSLVGGENETKTIDLEWNEDSEVTIYLATNITSDVGVEGPEINATYSDNPITIDEYGSRELEITISTATNIMPANYTVETYDEAVKEVITSTDTVYRDNDTLVDLLNETEGDLNETLDRLEDREERIEDLLDTIDELRDEREGVLEKLNITKEEVKDLKNKIEERDRILDETEDRELFYGLVSIFLLGLSTWAVVEWREAKKEQKEGK